jgi:hypothetical protein
MQLYRRSRLFSYDMTAVFGNVGHPRIGHLAVVFESPVADDRIERIISPSE